MKINQTKTMLFVIFLLVGREVSAQRQETEMFAIEPYPIELTTAKTTHLVFPYNIISVDRGSQNILAQKAKGTANTLQLKAASADFPQTNLTVITEDGKLYSFTVDYAAEPLQLHIQFVGGKLTSGATLENDRRTRGFCSNWLAKLKTITKACVG